MCERFDRLDECKKYGWDVGMDGREKEREGRNMYVIFGLFQKQERDGGRSVLWLGDANPSY